MTTASREVAFPLGRRLKVLEHRAALHDFTALEREALEALIGILRPGMTVYDVGTEQGDFAALTASIVGDHRVHLFEPTPRHWPSIRKTFNANGLTPGGFFPGFAGNASRPGWEAICRGGWPPGSDGNVVEESAFSVLFERPELPAVTLDDYAKLTKTRPDVITIDVEGGEILVLDGALGLLHDQRPLLFVSIHHPSAIERFSAPGRLVQPGMPLPQPCEQEHIFRLLSMAGYRGEFISCDHESHWKFVPK